MPHLCPAGNTSLTSSFNSSMPFSAMYEPYRVLVPISIWTTMFSLFFHSTICPPPHHPHIDCTLVADLALEQTQLDLKHNGAELHIPCPPDTCALFIELLYGVLDLESLSIGQRLALLRCAHLLPSLGLVQLVLPAIQNALQLDICRLVWLTAVNLHSTPLQDAVQNYLLRQLADPTPAALAAAAAMPITFLEAWIPHLPHDTLARLATLVARRQPPPTTEALLRLLHPLSPGATTPTLRSSLDTALCEVFGPEHVHVAYLRDKSAASSQTGSDVARKEHREPAQSDRFEADETDGHASFLSETDGASEVSSTPGHRAPRRRMRRTTSRRQLPMTPSSIAGVSPSSAHTRRLPSRTAVSSDTQGVRELSGGTATPSVVPPATVRTFHIGVQVNLLPAPAVEAAVLASCRGHGETLELIDPVLHWGTMAAAAASPVFPASPAPDAGHITPATPSIPAPPEYDRDVPPDTPSNAWMQQVDDVPPPSPWAKRRGPLRLFSAEADATMISDAESQVPPEEEPFQNVMAGLPSPTALGRSLSRFSDDVTHVEWTRLHSRPPSTLPADMDADADPEAAMLDEASNMKSKQEDSSPPPPFGKDVRDARTTTTGLLAPEQEAPTNAGSRHAPFERIAEEAEARSSDEHVLSRTTSICSASTGEGERRTKLSAKRIRRLSTNSLEKENIDGEFSPSIPVSTIQPTGYSEPIIAAETASEPEPTGPTADKPVPSLVVLGGDGMHGIARSVQYYHNGSQAWVHLPETTQARLRSACAVVENRIYVFGGDHAHGTAEMLDPLVHQEWQPIAPSKFCVAGSAASVVGGQVYLLGGVSPEQRVLDWAARYDPIANTWHACAPLPSPVCMHGQTVIADRYIVVVGGVDGDRKASRGAAVYDTHRDSWHPLPQLLTPRSRCQAVTLSGIVYVLGGLSASAAALNAVETLPTRTILACISSLRDHKWRLGNPMLQARYNFAAVTIFDRIAILGGSSPAIDLHDADAVLLYDPKLLFRSPVMSRYTHCCVVAREQADLWGYQNLNVARNLQLGTKQAVRRASRMRTKASLGRSLMSTLGVRSKLAAGVIMLPANQPLLKSVMAEVEAFERDFGVVNMPSGASTVYAIICSCERASGVNVMLAKVVPQLGNWRLYDEKTDGQDGWNLYWRSNSFVSYMITRKDLLCRAMRKMRKVYGAAYNFAPESFVLPTDLSKLEARMAEDPSQLSRGRGIYLFRTRDRLQYDQNSVVQSYIDRPLLIKGFKFDLRIYVHVTSFSPLTVYLYRKGLARFGTAKYSAENIENVCAHLTNTSINKLTPNMSSELPDMGAGCKSEGFDDRNIWRRIGNLAVLSIMALIEECPANPGCRELFGFDVLIDEALKLHLIEVNFGPALALDSDQDRDAKIPLIR
ncbi:uncharacterized protein MONBRDRAFT_4775 [Monosiga brevicollis MX1]|uniref:Attractin/MKLN-like beta-propeller domain-containing protein n=1 Tax=Monosiga brevicollis TaxID=81824 RepID=A9UNW5_MONBE|nr:uncharacterized protein MONBRDRAFT_4775 [Monosiga brevicollis MX1]EDQ92316.1 predicted protein [Monosiga brevicollis MX1]|eukprot:XP_001742078.1 hypothetical protein [Monosiga brevicollis MX1]